MNNATKWVIGVIIAIAVIAVGYTLYKGPSQPVSTESIKIGVLTPLTGQIAEYGQNVKAGLDLAVQEINNNGGVNGKKIQLIYQDTKCDPKETTSAFNNLVDIQGIKYILGSVCSSEVLAIAPLANNKKVIIIGAAASSPDITNAGDYIFRVYPSDDYEAKVAAETIYNKLDKKSSAIIYLNNDYGKALKDVFESYYKNLGGNIVDSEGYEQSAKDFRTQLVKIKEKNPEAVYMISYPVDGGLLVKQARALNINSQFIGTSGSKGTDIIKNGGNATEGLMAITIAGATGMAAQKFNQSYENYYGKKPGMFADRGYDSLYVLAKAIEGVSGDVKNNLYLIKDFDGASGKIIFNSNGDIEGQNYDVFVVKNGEFVKY
ncbi:MAG: hypothetical protein D4Q79_00470 [Spirochaetia bacterium]|nr:MAG: hypothetical protein D4Q79_00470 [Spirochaetia bacterium]